MKVNQLRTTSQDAKVNQWNDNESINNKRSNKCNDKK